MSPGIRHHALRGLVPGVEVCKHLPMPEVTDSEVEAIDLAVVAYRDEGEWKVAELPNRALDNVGAIAAELRRYPGETGSLAMLSIDEDFVLLVRAQGARLRVLLSDVTAATDWELARTAIEEVGVFVDVDAEEPEPAGDLGIVADFGFPAQRMAEVIDDLDLYPDEVLAEIAAALGFSEDFAQLAEIA